MPYPFHPVTGARPLVTGGLLAGLLLIVPASTPRVLAQTPVTAPPVADAPKASALNIEIPDLNTADEASVQTAWIRLQEQLQEGEVTDPAAAIALCSDFLDKGGSRFGTVAVDVAAHIAHLQFFELRHFDQAIETYSWAITNYPQVPDVERLKRERDVVKQQGQQRQEGKAPPLPLVKLQDVHPPSPLQVAPVTLTPLATPGKAVVSPVTLAALTLPPHLSLAPVRVPRSADFLVPRSDSLGWKPGSARCVTALARQKSGRLWVATEDAGVWSYEEGAPPSTRWKQFTAKDGVGDDSAYAVAIDKQNRVWVGTQSHGVSVWNGKRWKNYGVLDGPLGERIFALAVCPTDGDVWIATNVGLTRYSSSKDSWSTITRAEGLPSDHVQDLAFDALGNLLIGTQCDGVAVASAADDYKNWRNVKGPKQMPTSPKGTGLPSNLINAVLVARDGTFYVGTTTGLAWSRDKGRTWSYVRGQDYAAKVRGRLDGPPTGWKEGPGALLAEDYVSCLAQDGAGHLWVGHWRAGDEVLDVSSGPSASGIKKVLDQEGSGMVRAILPMANAAPLLARYDEGLGQSLVSGMKTGATIQPIRSPVPFPPLPSPAKAPTLKELNAMLAALGKIEPLDPKVPLVAALPDDWTTKGDWLGRYGRYWASLNAMASPNNYLWGGGWTPIDHAFGISPKQKDNALRYWVHWMQTADRRVLEMPPTYLDSRLQKGLTTKDQNRRQAEIDDNGETYPLTKEGPDIYFSVKIPPGLWTLSFYNDNKDGHDRLNRMRDYGYSIRLHDGAKPIGDVSDFDSQRELAHSRQRDFWGGVYKRFLVRGPQQLSVKISKNNSLDTILAGVFLDLVDEQPAPYFGTVEQWQKRQSAREQERDELNKQSAAERAARFAPATDEKDAVNRLFIEVERLRDLNPSEWARSNRQIYMALARAMKPTLKPTDVEKLPLMLTHLGSCYYHLGHYNDWEDVQRRLGLIPARDIEKSLKWDGNSSDGEGFQVISAHLLHPHSKETQ